MHSCTLNERDSQAFYLEIPRVHGEHSQTQIASTSDIIGSCIQYCTCHYTFGLSNLQLCYSTDVMSVSDSVMAWEFIISGVWYAIIFPQ